MFFSVAAYQVLITEVDCGSAWSHSVWLCGTRVGSMDSKNTSCRSSPAQPSVNPADGLTKSLPNRWMDGDSFMFWASGVGEIPKGIGIIFFLKIFHIIEGKTIIFWVYPSPWNFIVLSLVSAGQIRVFPPFWLNQWDISIFVLHISIFHGSLNVPIEHHPTIRYMVYNGYYKVMSNSPKMGHLPIPVLLSFLKNPGVVVFGAWTPGQVLYAFSDALDLSEPVASLPLLHCEAGKISTSADVSTGVSYNRTYPLVN